MVPLLYFRKWVAIDNKKLYMVQMASVLFILVAVVYFLLSMPVYQEDVVPVHRMDLWVDMPPASTLAPVNSSFCTGDLSGYSYWPDRASAWRFQNAQCAEVTADFCMNETTACLHRSSAVHKTPDEVFIASSFIEETVNASTGQTASGSYLVPGAESFAASALWSFQVEVPASYVHAMFGVSLLPLSELLTVLVRSDGTELGRFRQGEVVTLTVAEALEMAGVGLDDEAEGQEQEFPNNQDSRGSRRPKGRVTGIDIVFTIEYSNNLNDAGHGSGGPVAKVTAKATRAWMSHTSVEFIDAHGSSRTRTYQGVRMLFKHKGHLSWFQLNKVIYAVSLLIAWMQIPFFVVFFFAITCLGTLSEVYTGFLYEDVDLQQEFNGVSSRMLAHTYGFHDLHDREEADYQLWGISKQRAKRRMDMILDSSEELDEEERNRFTNFFFANCSSSMQSSNIRAIQIEDYRMAHMTNENLLFEDVLRIVDSDRRTGNIFEIIFMDASLNEFANTGELEEAKLLGKDRPKKPPPQAALAHGDLLSMVRRDRQLSVMASQCSLSRARYGQVVVQEQIQNLEKALDKMQGTCDRVHMSGDDGSGSEDDSDEPPPPRDYC